MVEIEVEHPQTKLYFNIIITKPLNVDQMVHNQIHVQMYIKYIVRILYLLLILN